MLPTGTILVEQCFITQYKRFKMARRANTVGGGANTNVNGLQFERETDINDILDKLPNYTVEGNTISKDDKKIAEYYEKHTLYNEFLLPKGIDFTKIISKKLLPDSAIYVEHKDVSTMFIIEKKYQGGSGSVDEKLQTCHFKKKQYEKLLHPLGIEVEYIYLLNDWFDQSMYADVFEYIKSVGCDYYINEIPLTRLKLE